MGNECLKRPPRLRNLFARFDPPLYFITFCTFDRRPVLANDALHVHFVSYLTQKSDSGIACGEYVIMPDHIHLFMRLDSSQYQQGRTVGFLKQALSKSLRATQIPMPHWQPGFFDHVLRSADSYSAKWEYVRDNPVRAGLADHFDAWPYQGTITPIQY